MDIDLLLDNTKAILALDESNSLVPYGLGGHARNLLIGLADAVESLRQQLAEAHKKCDEWKLKAMLSAAPMRKEAK